MQRFKFQAITLEVPTGLCAGGLAPHEHPGEGVHGEHGLQLRVVVCVNLRGKIQIK